MTIYTVEPQAPELWPPRYITVKTQARIDSVTRPFSTLKTYPEIQPLSLVAGIGRFHCINIVPVHTNNVLQCNLIKLFTY